jgi:hypothetical protein
MLGRSSIRLIQASMLLRLLPNFDHVHCATDYLAVERTRALGRHVIFIFALRR